MMSISFGLKWHWAPLSGYHCCKIEGWNKKKWHFRYRTLLCLAVFCEAFGQLSLSPTQTLWTWKVSISLATLQRLRRSVLTVCVPTAPAPWGPRNLPPTSRSVWAWGETALVLPTGSEKLIKQWLVIKYTVHDCWCAARPTCGPFCHMNINVYLGGQRKEDPWLKNGLFLLSWSMHWSSECLRSWKHTQDLPFVVYDKECFNASMLQSYPSIPQYTPVYLILSQFTPVYSSQERMMTSFFIAEGGG